MCRWMARVGNGHIAHFAALRRDEMMAIVSERVSDLAGAWHESRRARP